LIVGLGNPGPEYTKTRHNAGFMVVDRLAELHGMGQTPKSKFHAMILEANIKGTKCVLMKPTTYMNRSGMAVAEAVRFYKLAPAKDVLVIVDEAALNTGTIRVRPEGGANGHNGLKDIQQKLGGQQYPRLRVGVGPKPAVMVLHDFVLGRFRDEEQPALASAINKAADAVETFAAEGIDAAMNQHNMRDKPEASPGTTESFDAWAPRPDANPAEGK
ncbi:MAG: aminoacyl-tRNA hydrolase, partial [Planctomycetota bacterium]